MVECALLSHSPVLRPQKNPSVLTVLFIRLEQHYKIALALNVLRCSMQMHTDTLVQSSQARSGHMFLLQNYTVPHSCSADTPPGTGCHGNQMGRADHTVCHSILERTSCMSRPVWSTADLLHNVRSCTQKHTHTCT